jgi:hypothetical protein
MVQTWFESNYGKSKLITPPTSNFSLANNDDPQAYLNETFSITPKWTSTKIATYLQVLPVAIVPIEPIPFFDSKGLSYVLVCFIDSTRNINARLQIYKATEKYQNEHKSYDVKTFSGMFFQIALDGKLERIYGLKDGKFDSKLNLKKSEQGSTLGANKSSLTTRSNWQGCWSCNTVPGYYATFPIRCFFCSLGFGGNNEEITNDGTNSNYFYGSLGFGNPSTSLYPSATSAFDSGGGSSGSSNGNNTGSSTWGLSNEFDNSMFDINADLYAQQNRQNYVLTTLNLTGSEQVFLDQNKLIYNQLYDYLMNSGLSATEKKLFATQHLNSLMNNASYLGLNQQLGYLESTVQSYAKFAKAGFSGSEFIGLFLDQILFAQVDGFLNESRMNSEAVNEIKELANISLVGPGYPFEHPVSLAIRNFNKYIFRAFLYSNNFSDIYFHNYARFQDSKDTYRKAIGAIGEGIMAQKVSDESSVISVVTQGSTKGGEQHDILVRVPLYKINGSGTHDLRVHYTESDGSPAAYTQKLSGDRFKIGRISYEIKTFSDDIEQRYIVAGFVEGVQQVYDRTGTLGANAGVLVFDKNAYDIVKNHPDVVAALDRLNGFRDSNGNKKGFLRLENGLRNEVNRALYALIDRIKNINP